MAKLVARLSSTVMALCLPGVVIAAPPSADEARPTEAREIARAGWQEIRAGRFEQAEETFAEAVALAEADVTRAKEAKGDVAVAREALSRAYIGLGLSARRARAFERTHEAWVEAMGLVESLKVTERDPRRQQRRLAAALNRMGHAEAGLGRLDAAMDDYTTARELLQALVDEHPDHLGYRRDLAATWDHVGEVLLRRRAPLEAKEAFEESRSLREGLVAAWPDRWQLHHSLAKSLHRMGRVHGRLGEHDAARAAFREALEIKQRLVKAHPERAELQRSLANTYRHQGHWLRRTGALSEAREAYTAGADLIGELVEAHPHHEGFERDLEAWSRALRRVSAPRARR